MHHVLGCLSLFLHLWRTVFLIICELILLLQLLILTRKYYFFAVTSKKVLLLVLTHNMLLCVFFWLNACSYHMFCVFTKRFIRISWVDKWKIVLKYITYPYVLPLRIVSGNITFFFINSKGPRFGYGRNETLVDDKMAYIVKFIVPLSIICLANSFSSLLRPIRLDPLQKWKDSTKANFILSFVWNSSP